MYLGWDCERLFVTDFEYFFNTFDFNTKHAKTLLQAIELDCTAKEGDLKAGSCDLENGILS